MNAQLIEKYINRFNSLLNKPKDDESLTCWLYFGLHPIYSVDYATVMSDMVKTQNILNKAIDIDRDINNSIVDGYLSMATTVTGDTFTKSVITNPQNETFYIAEVVIKSSFLDSMEENPKTGIKKETVYSDLAKTKASGVFSNETGLILFGCPINSISDQDIIEKTLYELVRV